MLGDRRNDTVGRQFMRGESGTFEHFHRRTPPTDRSDRFSAGAPIRASVYGSGEVSEAIRAKPILRAGDVRPLAGGCLPSASACTTTKYPTGRGCSLEHPTYFGDQR